MTAPLVVRRSASGPTSPRDLLGSSPSMRELAELIPHVRLTVLPGAAHGANLVRPGEFNRTVLDFLLEHAEEGGEAAA